MRKIALAATASIAFLAACQHPGNSSAEVGSPAWLEKVDQALSISDGQGHGPDYGSQEWCDAVHFKLYGERPAKPVPCNRAWMQQVDEAL